MIDPVKALEEIPSFAGLSDAALRAIAGAAVKRTFASGETVFREGQRSAGLCIVLDGWLKAYKTSENGREQVVRFARSGETLNEIGAYAGGENKASAEALEAASVLFISHEHISVIMHEYPQIGVIITENLAKRVLHLMTMVEDLSLRTVSQRLARMFVDHSSGDVLSRRNWSTQSEMAARLGTVPDVLNRAIRTLVEDGLIRIDRRSVHILDREGLEEKARTTEKE